MTIGEFLANNEQIESLRKRWISNPSITEPFWLFNTDEFDSFNDYIHKVDEYLKKHEQGI